MNDRRFIELLNLYVDQQIDAAEAAELEAEVLRSPERRITYNDYCRLQRGCSLLGEGARSLAPTSSGFARSLREAERKLAAPRRPVWRPVYLSIYGSAAMAACATFLILANRPPTEASRTELANEGGFLEVGPPLAATIPATPVVNSIAFTLQPGFSESSVSVARNAREAEIASNDREALEWMQRVDGLPTQQVVLDEHAFEALPVMQQENRVFRSRHSLQGNTEFTAFQFQR